MEVDDLRRALGEVMDRLGDARTRVAGVGLAGMAESGAPLDRTGRPMAPVIAWHDGRGEEAVARLERKFGTDLAARVGQPLRAVMTVAKLGWLVENGVTGVVRWLGVPELGLQALTGEEATEFSLAARTGCYDVAGRRWMPEVAEALRFGIDVFPAVMPAGAAMGRVSKNGAAWSGLPEDIPVTIAGHDHLAGMVGAGVGHDEVANSVGTAETIVARTPTVPDISAALGLRVAVTVNPGGKEWAALVSAVRAGLVLEGAASALGRSLQELDGLAEGASPADVADAVDAFARGERPSLPDVGPGEVWAGLLAALADRTADAYTRLTEVVGPAAGVVVFGGGSASKPWLRAKAERLPVPVRRSTVSSAVARGAALQAGVAAGWWPTPPGVDG